MIEILFGLILLLAVNALAVIGFNYATMYAEIGKKKILQDSKNILWFVRYYGNMFLSEQMQKPFYNCLRCMPSIHASYIYFPTLIYCGIEWQYCLIGYPFYVLALSGLLILIESKFGI